MSVHENWSKLPEEFTRYLQMFRAYKHDGSSSLDDLRGFLESIIQKHDVNNNATVSTFSESIIQKHDDNNNATVSTFSCHFEGSLEDYEMYLLEVFASVKETFEKNKNTKKL